jgi:hypothetical protein
VKQFLNIEKISPGRRKAASGGLVNFKKPETGVGSPFFVLPIPKEATT